MTKGDIIIVEPNKIFWLYDRYVALVADVTGVNLMSTDEIFARYPDYKICSLKTELPWTKRKKLNELMAKLLTKETSTSFKERLKFLEYIVWFFHKQLNIRLTDAPTVATVGSLLNSPFLHVSTVTEEIED